MTKDTIGGSNLDKFTAKVTLNYDLWQEDTGAAI